MERTGRGTDVQSLQDFCLIPRSKSEIAQFLGVKTLCHAMGKYVKPLLETGEMAMTMPDKPQSKNQKYYTVNDKERIR